MRFLGSLAAGELIVEHVSAADWLRIAEIVGPYHDLRLGTVDASLVAIAERLGVSTLLTSTSATSASFARRTSTRSPSRRSGGGLAAATH